MNTKIYILTKKGAEHEKEIVKQMEKVVRIAAQIANKQVDVEITTEFGKFDGMSMDANKTPMVIIHNTVQFATKPPPVDLIRQALIKDDQMPKM